MERKWCLQETLGLSYIKIEGTFEEEDEGTKGYMIIGYNDSSFRAWEGREGLFNKGNISSSMGIRIGKFKT